MPLTVDGFLLLGWLDRAEALRWLTQECCFDAPLSETEAEALWLKYKARVDALEVRTVKSPDRRAIPLSCQATVKNFLAKFRGPEVLDVISIDPMKLVIYQPYVIADRANLHANQLGGNQWAKTCLPLDRPMAGQLPMRLQDDTFMVNLPHAEFFFSTAPVGFQIQQAAGFISICDVDGRTVLKAGYHRTFAFSRARMNDPDAKDKSLLVAVTKTVPPPLLASCPTQGLRTTIMGSRPPLFSDFFDESLVMAVKLRKKRYEFHLKVSVVPIDET